MADASAFVEYLLRTGRAGLVEGVFESPGVELHAPALCDVEVVSAFRRALRTGLMEVARAGLALEAYLDFPVARHGHAGLMARALALRDNFTAYDAMYVALAELLGLIADRRVNVVSVMTTRGDAETVTFVLRVSTVDAHGLARHLRGSGVSVAWPPEKQAVP